LHKHLLEKSKITKEGMDPKKRKGYKRGGGGEGQDRGIFCFRNEKGG